MSKLMRVSDTTAAKLDSLCKLTGQSKQKLLDKAIALFVHEQALKKANAQYAKLKKNSRAWKAVQDEQKLWDVTLSDGLKHD